MAEANLGKVMGSRMLFVSAPPNPGMGLQDDWAFDTASGKVWQKTSTGWVYRGDIKEGNILSINGLVADEEGKLALTASDVGATSYKLLWRNESPSSAFPAQDIIVPGLSDCGLLLFVFTDTNEYAYIQNSIVVEIATTAILKGGAENRAVATDYKNHFHADDSSADNSHLVPLAIFGFRN